jgi:hypothetical protein
VPIRLFGKRIEVVVGDRRFTEHEIQFKASLTLTPDPDTAEIKLFNLHQDDQFFISAANRGAQVAIFAGYEAQDPLPQIFPGRLKRVWTTREGPDRITNVEASSAIQSREYGRQLNRTYRQGATVGAVIRDLLDTLEVGQGTLRTQIDGLRLEGVGQRFRAPFSVQGPAWDSLVEILESNGLTVTTQGDDLVALGVSDVLNRTAIVLSEATGLRGSPSVDKKGNVTVEAAMIPDMVPGRRIRVESDVISGDYKVTRVDYSGSLFGEDFGLQLEGKAL